MRADLDVLGVINIEQIGFLFPVVPQCHNQSSYLEKKYCSRYEELILLEHKKAAFNF